MNHLEATTCLRNKLEIESEQFDEIMNLRGWSEPQTTRFLTARLAPGIVLSLEPEAEKIEKPGQIAESLSGWHEVLYAACRMKYELLTGGYEGEILAREEANSNPELLSLQAIRRGVRDAMKIGYKCHSAQPWPLFPVGCFDTVSQWAAD